MVTCPFPAQARILLADDNELFRVSIGFMLRHLGHDVESVSNGREAVEAASRRAYEFVFLDLQMPLMGGFEAARSLRREARGGLPPRIIGLSAEETRSETYSAAGMDAFLLKPVRLADLARLLELFGLRGKG